jgi:hypothetical protein
MALLSPIPPNFGEDDLRSTYERIEADLADPNSNLPAEARARMEARLAVGRERGLIPPKRDYVAEARAEVEAEFEISPDLIAGSLAMADEELARLDITKPMEHDGSPKSQMAEAARIAAGPIDIKYETARVREDLTLELGDAKAYDDLVAVAQKVWRQQGRDVEQFEPLKASAPALKMLASLGRMMDAINQTAPNPAPLKPRVPSAFDAAEAEAAEIRGRQAMIDAVNGKR